MGLEVEIWRNVIEEELRASNQFLNTATPVPEENILAGRVVHKPMANQDPTAVLNGTPTFPLTVEQLADSTTTYVLDRIYTLPSLITNEEMKFISYDKIASVLRRHIETISDLRARNIIYRWLNTFVYSGSTTVQPAPVIRTTGAATAAHLPSATGNRKLITINDIKAARTRMNKDNVPANNRYLLISSDLLDQLLGSSELLARDSSGEVDLVNGVVARLYGFNIIERSTTATYTNAATPVVKALGTAAAATDNDVAIAYQTNYVEYAMGDFALFEREKDPLYLGSLYNIEVFTGGQKLRADAKGIVAIVQDASA